MNKKCNENGCKQISNVFQFNCMGCQNNNFEFDILFDGEAKEVGETYDLLKPITDYSLIAIEYGVSNIEGKINEWTRGTSWVILPKPSDICFEHNAVYGMNLMLYENKIGVSQIFWHFPKETTLIIDEKAVQINADDMRISKIYGVC